MIELHLRLRPVAGRFPRSVGSVGSVGSAGLIFQSIRQHDEGGDDPLGWCGGSYRYSLIGELLKHLIAFIKPWPWATIAAFMAVGVTLLVAYSGTRQKRRQLRQEAILKINFQANAWGNAAGVFLAHAIAWLNGGGSGKFLIPFALSISEPMATACYAMDRVLKSAHMTCNDFQVIRRVSEAENQVVRFQKLLNGPHADADDIAGLIAELVVVKDQGQQIQRDFAATTEALVRRGFETYALPKGPIFRIRHRSTIIRAWVKRKVGR